MMERNPRSSQNSVQRNNNLGDSRCHVRDHVSQKTMGDVFNL
jgi:hypothetical protein